MVQTCSSYVQVVFSEPGSQRERASSCIWHLMACEPREKWSASRVCADDRMHVLHAPHVCLGLKAAGKPLNLIPPYSPCRPCSRCPASSPAAATAAGMKSRRGMWMLRALQAARCSYWQQTRVSARFPLDSIQHNVLCVCMGVNARDMTTTHTQNLLSYATPPHV
jgi:hypothetical protein